MNCVCHHVSIGAGGANLDGRAGAQIEDAEALDHVDEILSADGLAGVFIGPAVVLTNDVHPRAVTPDGTLKTGEDWDCVGVTVGAGAAIGARSVCVAPVHIGQWAMVAAGSVVTRDVPDFALVVGSPARQVGWVGRAGVRLVEDAERSWSCPRTGERYHLEDGLLRLIDVD